MFIQQKDPIGFLILFLLILIQIQNEAQDRPFSERALGTFLKQEDEEASSSNIIVTNNSTPVKVRRLFVFDHNH